MSVLYQKYRPSTFHDVTGQYHVITTIQNQVGSGSLAHAYLFTGPRGVGKTTTARLLAKIVNCTAVKDSEPCNTCEACVSIISGQALDVYEIDAASHTDVENVRENIIKSVRFAPNVLKKKVYIIDEVHMLSTSSFNALLKTLEEPPSHALFILATTEIHKVPETIISRCQRFDFRRIAQDVLIERLKRIASEEGIDVDDQVFVQIAKYSGGCARDAESLLGQVFALGEKKITLELASLVLPATNAVLIEAFVQSILQKDVSGSLQQLNEYLDQGIDLVQFMDDVISRLRDILLETVSKSSPPLPRGDQGGFAVPDIRLAIETLLDARHAARGDFLPQLPIELALVELCESKSTFSTKEVASVIPKKELTVSEVPIVVKPLVVVEPVQIIVDTVINIPTEAPVESLEIVETVFDSVPVISIDEIKKKWPEVFEQLKDCNASLPLLMNSCEVNEVSGNHVELAFEYDLHVQAVNKEKNRVLIENVLQRVLGQSMRIRAVKSAKGPSKEVVDLAEQFGGTIT